MGTFNTGDGEIKFDDSGKGNAILFLHSFNQSRLMWERQLDHFLSLGYRVIAMDIRGHGESEFVPGKHTVDHFADDAIKLLEHLGVRKAYVAGLSLGGYIALGIWRKRKDLIAGLILSGTKAAADTEEIKERRRGQIRLIDEEGLGRFVANTYRRLAERTARERPWTVEFMQMLSRSDPPEVVKATLEALMEKPDDTSALESIDVPTLIIVGEEDHFTPPHLSEDMKNRVKGSELRIFPDAGHFCVLDIPENYSRTVEDFMKNNGWK